VDRYLEQPSAVKASFRGLGRRTGKIPFAGRNADDPQRGLISRQGDVNIQGMSGSPINQLFRSISPAQPEGWFQHGLTEREGGCGQPEAEEPACDAPEKGEHGRTLGLFRRSRKPAGWRRGSVLVEVTIAMSILSVLGLALLKLSLNITAPRQWTLQQSVTDAYLTFEKATAQRLPFADLTSAQSLWPVHPALASSTVEFGKLPGGVPITGTVTRTRFADPNNLPARGGSGTLQTNPAAMEVWRFQSVIRYSLGGRNYLKSRTVVRSQ